MHTYVNIFVEIKLDANSLTRDHTIYYLMTLNFGIPKSVQQKTKYRAIAVNLANAKFDPRVFI
jgi:hypothetical protein